MAGREEDVKVGASKYSGRQALGTSAQTQEKDYKEAAPAPLFEPEELKSWSFWRAGIAEFVATFLFLYITILTVMEVKKAPNMCQFVGVQGISWAFRGMIFVLVYCTTGILGGHINPAVTFGLFLSRKVSLPRVLLYMICQCLGAICRAGVVEGFEKGMYDVEGGGANLVVHGYTKGDGLGVEIVQTFVLVYIVLFAIDAKRSARDSHVPVLASLLIHLATILITGIGTNLARSLVLPSFMTRTMPGMITGFSGWDPFLALLLLLFTTSSSSGPFPSSSVLRERSSSLLCSVLYHGDICLLF